MWLKEFLLIEARIQEEKENFTLLIDSLKKRGLFPLTEKGKTLLADNFMLRAVASVLLDYYTAAENIFKEVAKAIDGKVPEGQDWHKELLVQMKLNIPGIRPPVLSRDTFSQLDEYRRFRHLVRHLYGFNLLPEKVESLLKSLPGINESLKKDLNNFCREMKNLIIENYPNNGV